MSDYTVTIPEQLYEKARVLAEQTEQPVEDVIRERLADGLDAPRLEFPADERAELRALAFLSDDTLWTIAREQMQSAKQAIMSALMDKNSRGTITDAEYNQLETLVEDGQRLTLRKAEAMRLLMERGYKVRLDDLMPADE